MNPTLNQLREDLRATAESHAQVNNFIGFTSDSRVNSTPDKKYPLIAAGLLPSTLSNTNSSFDINIRIMVCDLLTDSNANETEIYSDTLQIMNDYITLLRRDYRGTFIIPTDIPIVPFTEKSDDGASGWSADFVIRIPNLQDYCAIPRR